MEDSNRIERLHTRLAILALDAVDLSQETEDKSVQLITGILINIVKAIEEDDDEFLMRFSYHIWKAREITTEEQS